MAKTFECSERTIVQTAYGEVQGYCYDGIYTFFGIPYAKSKRFRMPEHPDSWQTVKDVTNWGYLAPSLMHLPAGDMIPRRFWLEDENCQNLNIWTPDIHAETARPVLVWLHGGAYSFGSPFAHTDYDGEELAAYGNCVVVSVSHRLNLFGFLDLSEFGEQYANSGNTGIADLVMALRWIRENIAQFGGNPDNVTICGQSGGGGKVTALMQTPAADGLFQKAMIISGIMDHDFTGKPEDHQCLIHAMIQELGVTEKENPIASLEELPFRKLIELYFKVLPDLHARGIHPVFSPAVNDYYLGFPTAVGFRKHAQTIPLIVGTVFGEFVSGRVAVADRNAGTDEAAREILQKRFGKNTDEVIAMYREAYPDRRLTDLMSLESLMRNKTLDFIRLFAADAAAPVFNYVFAYDFPINGWKPAWHSSDQVFQFHTTDKAPFSNSIYSDRLQDQYAGMWVNFAYSGHPSGKEFSQEWKPYTLTNPNTMIIGEKTEMRVGYDEKLIRYMADRYPDQMPGFTLQK